MITQTIEIQGLERTLAALLKVEDEVSHLRPLWERLGEEFRADEVQLFSRQPWTPLAPATIKQKQAKGFGGKGILRATDTLFKSLTEKGEAGVSGINLNISRVDDLSAQFGTANPLAVFHHFGTKRMPARPVIIEPDVDKYANLAERYLADVVRNAGFN